jgi:ABC-type glycerol-3-phosphate transport system permease component
MKARQIFAKSGLSIVIIIAIVWSLFPVFYLIVISFAGRGALPTSFALPKRLTLENWRTILILEPIWKYMGNSLFVTAINIIITLLIVIPAAYSFSRFKSRLNGMLFRSFLFFRLLPYISVMVPLFFMMQSYRLLGTRVGLSLAHLLYTLPLGIWLMKGFFDMLSPEIEEAALIDGANTFQMFSRVVLPLIRAGIAVTALIVFLFSYIDFLFALILTREPTFTLPVRLGAYMTIHETYWRLIACSSLISLIPMVIIFAVLQKHLVRGLTLGAVK